MGLCPQSAEYAPYVKRELMAAGVVQHGGALSESSPAKECAERFAECHGKVLGFMLVQAVKLHSGMDSVESHELAARGYWYMSKYKNAQ